MPTTTSCPLCVGVVTDTRKSLYTNDIFKNFGRGVGFAKGLASGSGIRRLNLNAFSDEIRYK